MNCELATDTDNERTEVLVYRDGPEWDRLGGRKWFTMPTNELRALFVARYSVLDRKFQRGLDEINSAHPNSVLVYTDPA